MVTRSCARQLMDVDGPVTERGVSLLKNQAAKSFAMDGINMFEESYLCKPWTAWKGTPARGVLDPYAVPMLDMALRLEDADLLGMDLDT